MVNALKLFFLTFFTLTLIDLLWLGYLMKDFYLKYLGIGQLNWISALGVYVLLAAGLIVFVLPKQNVLYGGFFGLVAYGIYDLTNHAILPHWPFILVFVDVLWGMTLCTTTTAIVTLYIKYYPL